MKTPIKIINSITRECKSCLCIQKVIAIDNSRKYAYHWWNCINGCNALNRLEKISEFPYDIIHIKEDKYRTEKKDVDSR